VEGHVQRARLSLLALFRHEGEALFGIKALYVSVALPSNTSYALRYGEANALQSPTWLPTFRPMMLSVGTEWSAGSCFR
jgi:hypothetical protein